MLNCKKRFTNSRGSTGLCSLRCVSCFSMIRKCCSVDCCTCSFMINPRYKYVVCMALNKTGTLVNYTDLCITSTFFQLHYSPPTKKKKGGKSCGSLSTCNMSLPFFSNGDSEHCCGIYLLSFVSIHRMCGT